MYRPGTPSVITLEGASRVVNLGSNATTNTALLQAALDAGGHVYVRTGGSINGTLLIGDDTTLELGAGVTISQTAETDLNMLNNSDTENGNSNITIKGGTWDYSGQTPASNAHLHAIVLHKVSGLHIEGVHGVGANKYVWLIADAENVTVKDISFDTPSDGIHFQGPLTNADIRNVRGTTGDDMVAFTIGDYSAYELSRGDMKNVVVDGVYCDSAKSALKMAGNDPYMFEGFTIQNVYGTCTAAVLNLVDGTDLEGTIADKIEFRNIQAQTTSSIGVITITAPDVRSLLIDGLVTDNTANPMVSVSGSVDSLRLINVSARNGLAGDVIKITGTVGTLLITDADVVLGATVGRLVNADGTVGTININGISLEAGTDCVRCAGGKTLGVVQISNAKITDTDYILRAQASFTAMVNNVTGTGVNNFALSSGATTFLTLLVGHVSVTTASANPATVFLSSSGTARVNGITFPVNVATLTPQAGDVVTNTSTSGGLTTGPNIYTGSAWKSLYPAEV